MGKPESSKKSRGDQFFFVNNRFIRSAYLNHAVLAAYEGLLARDTHPFYVLFLELDPKAIDINVHPTKTEIKFEDEKTVYAVVRAAVKQSLGLHNIAPSLDFDGDVNFAPIRPLRAGKTGGRGRRAPARGHPRRPRRRRPDELPPRRPGRRGRRPPRGGSSSGFGNFNADTRRDGFERQLPPRPTEQARRELEAFYRELGQPVRDEAGIDRRHGPQLRNARPSAGAGLPAPLRARGRADLPLGLAMPEAAAGPARRPAREGAARAAAPCRCSSASCWCP